MYSLWLPDILIILAVSVWFIFRIRKENVRSKGYYAFSGLLYLAGIVLIWALSRVLLYEIYTRYMLTFSGFNTTLDPYGNAQLIAGVVRWAAQGAWAWFLGNILKRGRRGHLSTGQFFICLSDGMGSGLEASRESEGVVDTLEQLVGAGFSGETAARMVNSVLNLKNRNGRFSTVDISIIDLYSGMCHFLKAGAATTFIKRSHWVEAISSTSLALGLVQQVDFEASTKKLYEGDFLIMVTDGVLDALPGEEPEEIMKEIIMGINASAAQELGKGILERVLTYCEYRATDDMTVLAAGLWRK